MSDLPRHQPRTFERGTASKIGVIGGWGLFAFLSIAFIQAVQDTVSMLPPRPPTKAEVAAALPQAKATWVLVYKQLSQRLPDPPPEVGEVWATRTGRVCGFVDDRESAVDNMKQFYTAAGAARLKDERQREYIKVWKECLNDRWVELHVGTEKSGFCATRRGRSSFIGRTLLCRFRAFQP